MSDSGVPGAGSDVLLDRFSRRQLGCVFLSVLAALAAMLGAGAAGPDAVYSQAPVGGDNVGLNNTCYYTSTGETTQVPSCWNRANAQRSCRPPHPAASHARGTPQTSFASAKP